MTSTLHVFAPAKINLFLHILGQNPNGYHNLQTIFQLLDFGDTLTFEPHTDQTIHCITADCPFPQAENLVYRAAKLLQQHTQCTQGATIYLNKQIPMGAGLGGGSSDAGATLRALNQLWQLDLPIADLIKLGAQLGADVPVFVLNQNAWAEGIGERLTPIDLIPQDYVIVDPRCNVSTKTIFAHPALSRNTAAISIDDYSFNTSQNDCEELVCSLYPSIGEARTWLKQFGTPRLTGTGGCLFLSVASKTIGEEITRQAPSQWNVICCRGLVKTI